MSEQSKRRMQRKSQPSTVGDSRKARDSSASNEVPQGCINETAKVHTMSRRQPSIFFGYDLPEYITPDDIISFMVKYKHAIVDVEIILNERCGNYAKVTVLTSSDTYAAMKYYSGKHWNKYNLTVTLKAWKEKVETKPPNKRHQEMAAYAAKDTPASMKSQTKSSHSISESHYTASNTRNLGHVKRESELQKQQKRLPYYEYYEDTGSYKSQHNKEYSIKLSGLKLDVKEKRIFELVKYFGYLIRPVRVARYPENGICYAYVDYSSRQSAIQAVQELDETEFGGSRIHVCHKGELAETHSCKDKLHTLSNSKLLHSDSPNSTDNNTTEMVCGATSHNKNKSQGFEENLADKSEDVRTYRPGIKNTHNCTEIPPYTFEPDTSEHKLNMSMPNFRLGTKHQLSSKSAINEQRLSTANQHLDVLCSTEPLSSGQKVANDSSFSSLAVSNIYPGISVQELEMHLKSYGSLAAPISIRYEGDSDTFSAVVHYVSVDDSVKAMSQLHGSSLNGYQLHVINRVNNISGAKMAKSDLITVKEYPPTVFGKPLQQVAVSRTDNKYTKLSKRKSSTTQLNAPVFPVVKSMSNSLQHYVQARLADKITELQQHGGDVEWSENSVIVTGIDQQVLDDFDKEILSSLDEFTSPSLTSNNWNKLTHVNEDDTSFISQLISDYSEVKIDLDCRNRSVSIMGPQVFVLEVRKKIFKEIYQELPLLEYKMFVLITCLPNLVNDIACKFGVTVTGFVEDSNCLRFLGEKIDIAYGYVMEQVALCKSREFPCNMDTSLAIVAINHFKKVGIAVVVCNTNGQRLLPILLSNRNANIDVFIVHSIYVDEINHAIDILETTPCKQALELPSADIMDVLQDSITEIQSMHSVYLQVSLSKIVIQGYAEKEVSTAFKRLQKEIDDSAITTVTLSFSKEELQFLRHIMFVKPTEKAKKLLSLLSKSLSIMVKDSPVSIGLTGPSKAVADGIKCISQELLNVFQVKAVSSRCHSRFLSQIDEFVRKPLEEEFRVAVYSFIVRKSERYTPTETVMIYTKVYSTDDDDFKEACEVISSLDPKSYFFPLTEDEFECIADEDADKDLPTIGNPYRVRIELRHNQVGVVLHALTKKDADDCYQSLKQHISSSLKLVDYIEITAAQLKFLQLHKTGLLKAHNIQVEKFVSSSPKLKLQGKKHNIRKVLKEIKETLNKIIINSHKCEHGKYLLMWKKCWEDIYTKISDDDDELFTELITSASGDTITYEIVVVGEDVQKVNDVISHAQTIDGSVKQCVISTDRTGIKIVKEGLKSGEIGLRKDMIYHCEVSNYDIVIVSPYCTQAEEAQNIIEAFIISGKNKLKIVKQFYEVKYSFSIKKMQLHWNEVQEIARSNKVLTIKLVTDPCGGIEVKGTEAAVKKAEPHFLKYIFSMEGDITCSELAVDYLSRPALRSPEFVQLCKELQSDLPVSLTVQFQPEVLSSASVPGCDITVEICEGSIALENSDVFINFTDENLTASEELKTVVAKCEPVSGRPVSVENAASSQCGQGENQKVIHVVLPKWIDGKSCEKSTIASAVNDSLTKVESFKATSVSLPFISCIDSDLPMDVLAKACLSAMYKFSKQSCSIKTVRVVLPVDMANSFQTELMSRSEQYTVTKPSCDHPALNNTQNTPKKTVSAWLWEDDNGKYRLYQAEYNRFLKQKYLTDTSCSMKIGKFYYIVDFKSMTQTNTKTNKVRKVKHVTNEHVWMFKNDQQTWQEFQGVESLIMEASYVTGTHFALKINGQSVKNNFPDMTQLNEVTCSKTEIKRIFNMSAVTCHETSTNKSRILIFGLPSDIKQAETKLQSAIKLLTSKKSITVQHRMIPTLNKHIKQIMQDYRVEIKSASSASSQAKYNITGYKECVQGAVTAIYQVLATTTTTSTPVQQSSSKPSEWEPQTDPIELKPVTEGSLEWNKILNRIKQTIPLVKLVSIERIQNEFLWEKYRQHKERMSYKGPERVNELELFHGSSSTAPEEIYKSEEGFDMRFSHQGMWGRGNYFAKDARYSYSYAYETESHGLDTIQGKVKQIFLAVVLTGDSYVSSPNKSLRLPPYKPTESSEKICYDTVNGVSAGSRIYITYSNDKAYPLYLISFCQSL